MNGRKLLPGDPLLEPKAPGYTIRRDTLDEVFSDAFLRRLAHINAIVMRSGEPLEGNIFYPDGGSVNIFYDNMFDVINTVD